MVSIESSARTPASGGAQPTLLQRWRHEPLLHCRLRRRLVPERPWTTCGAHLLPNKHASKRCTKHAGRFANGGIRISVAERLT